MSERDQDLRLDCLKLAHGAAKDAADVVGLAQQFYIWMRLGPESQEQQKALGDAIGLALYQTPYDGKLNIPMLSSEQKLAAAKAVGVVLRGLAL